MIEDTSTAQIIRDLAKDSDKLIVHDVPELGIRIARIRGENGEEEIVDLEKYEHRDKPARMFGTVIVHDVASFTNYFNDYKLPDSRIYFDRDATPAPGVFTGHINHPAREAASFTDYQVRYPLRYSDPWKAWSANSGKEMGQKAFGTFIEDNLVDIKDASANLLDAVFNFQAMKTTKVSQATKLRDGTVSFEFVEELKDVGKVKLPETFILDIPVFFRDKHYDVEVRIRYVVPDDGQLKLRYEIIRPERVIDAAAADVVQAIQTLSDTTVLFGRRG
jgi:uncharacterized protein YfdQ (DUF2303 family)